MNILSRLAVVFFLFGILSFATSCSNIDDDDSGDDDIDDDDNSANDDDASDDDDASPEPLGYVPILDEHGRTLVLHGCNYMGMEFGWFEHSSEDFERMAGWGFNVVRLPIAWHYLEPEEGVWDLSYLSNIVEPIVGYAHEAGLKVILDMHQFMWSPCCGGNGIPAWTCEDIGTPPLEYFFQAALFWENSGYVDEFVKAWETVAEFFAADDRIWGYDLFNEPAAGFVGMLPGVGENEIFRPLFLRFIEAIRKHHPEPYILFEPSIITNLGFASQMQALNEERLIFAPHLYPMAILEVGYWFGKNELERQIKQKTDKAFNDQVPVLIGETCIRANRPGSEDFTRDFVDLMDNTLTGFTWWVFWPEDDGCGLIMQDGGDKELFLRYLDRPYPRVTAGLLRKIEFDVETKIFSMSFDTSPAMEPVVEIYVPGARHYPNGWSLDVSDPEGTWSSNWDPITRILSVTLSPDIRVHTLSIRTANAD